MPLDRAKWPFIALLACAAVMATAYAVEIFLHFAPCQMCWWQRYAYMAAGAIALVSIGINWRGARPGLMSATCLLLGVVFLVGAFIAGWHALVEWKILPALEGCVASGTLDPESDLWGKLGKPIAVASCADAPFRVPNVEWGLSMAGANAFVSLALAVGSLMAASRPMRTDTANEPVRVSSEAHEHV
ncbi:MAG: disulfide bond formation protein B [Hyphomonadaceae bacterium]|nr:disulfide bond formation protein B [Hyphomonadaceae bacterium]